MFSASFPVLCIEDCRPVIDLDDDADFVADDGDFFKDGDLLEDGDFVDEDED